MKLSASSKHNLSSGVTTYSRSVSSGSGDTLGQPEHEAAGLHVVGYLDKVFEEGHRVSIAVMHLRELEAILADSNQ